MAVAFVCDICNATFKFKDTEVNTISFDCRNIDGDFLLPVNHKDRKDYHICPKCKQNIMRYINDSIFIYKNKEESE